MLESDYKKAWETYPTGAPTTKRPRLPHILSAVVLQTGIPASDIKSDRRTKDVAVARQIFCYLARHMTPNSFPQIGRFICRDHTTVMHAVRRVEALLKEGHPDVTAAVDGIKPMVVRIANDWEGAI